MLSHELFDLVPAWLLVVGTVAVLMAAAEIGNRLGSRRKTPLRNVFAVTYVAKIVTLRRIGALAP